MKLEKINYKKQQRLKKRLEREADRLFHLAVLRKWGNECFFEKNCSCKRAKSHEKTTEHAHHFFRKGLYPSLRYNVDNGVPICWACHYKLESWDSTMASDIREVRGKSWYNYLLELSKNKELGFQTISYYQKKIIELSNLIQHN